MSAIELRPCTLAQAKAFVAEHHRHCAPARWGRFAIAALSDDCLVGVAVVGNPVARGLADGLTAEVTRLCVSAEAPRNTCSRLYGACWRAWRAMGGRRLVTYTLVTETGAAVRGAGFKLVAQVRPSQWSTPSRPRSSHPVYSLA